MNYPKVQARGHAAEVLATVREIWGAERPPHKQRRRPAA